MDTIIQFSQNELEKLINESMLRALNEYQKPKEPLEDDLIKIKELSKILGISEVTLHKYKKDGKIPYNKVGRNLYFKKKDVLKSLGLI